MILAYLSRLGLRLRSQHQRYRSRRQLGQLDEHLLQDIGLDRAAAEREVRKPFWR